MAFLNFSFGRTAYTDEIATHAPIKKAFEFSSSEFGMPVMFPAFVSKTVYPGQTVLLDSTDRTLTIDGTTEFNISYPVIGSDIVRLRYTGTGTAPGFRTYRNIGGDATTTVNIDRTSNTSAKITNVAGTVWNLASVVIGDDIFFQKNDDVFTSPFSENFQNVNMTIIDKGSDYLVVRDNGTMAPIAGIVLGTDYLSALRVFSNAGVKVNDTIRFSPTSAFKLDNKAYPVVVTGVTDRDLYYISPFAVAETTVGGLNCINVFERLLSFMSVESTGNIKIRLNNTEDVQLTQYKPNKAFFAGTISASSVYAINETDTPINVVIQTATFN